MLFSYHIGAGAPHTERREGEGRQGVWVGGREEVSLGMMEQPSFLHGQQSHTL